MKSGNDHPLVLAMTGASGVAAARSLLRRSPWPVALIASKWARKVYELECGSFEELAAMADEVYPADDLEAPFSSGSVPTRGMVILPCTANTLAQVAGGLAGNLITRAAHCHLKERRPLVLALRETPLSRIDLENALRVHDAGAVVMPFCPPFYMLERKEIASVCLEEIMDAFADRILQFLGAENVKNWGDVR